MTTIIIGNPGSGKSTAAKEVAKYYGGETTLINGRSKFPINRFYFNNCNPSTKNVIVDDVISLKRLERLICESATGVMVELQGKKPFAIEPNFILICASDKLKRDAVLNLEPYLLRRVDFIIDCDKDIKKGKAPAFPNQ